jgi:selenocysteine-specific elongation factor
MPVDRVFTLAGRGCVVAGTIWSGQVSAGDNVELASSSTPVRVREIEAHGLSVFTSKTGHRTALNLTGISANDVQRGDELIQPGVFPRSRHILAEVRVLAGKPEIKCPATLHLHSGTASCAARITGIKKLLPSTSAIVVMETNSPLISTFGQFGLLRLPYPIGTFGGVRMLASLDLQARRTRKLIEFGEKLAIGNAEERLIAWVEFSGELEPTAAWSELQLGIPAAQQETVLQQALNSEKIHRIPHSPRIVAAETLRRLKQHVVDLLARRAEDTHDAWSVEESVVRQAAGFGSSELIRWAIGNLLDDGTIVRLGNMLAIASDENSLSKRQLARMNEIANLFEDNRSPPSTKEIAAQLQLSEDIVVSLTRFAVQAGILIDTGNGLLVSSQVFQKFCNELNELFSDNPQRSVAEIKDRWQVTRKHAIPFLEYCDRMQITRRKENLRTAGPVLGEFIG